MQPLTVDQYCYSFRPRLKPPPIRHNPITAGLWSPLVSSPVSVETAPDHSSGVGSALVVSSSVELIDLFAGSDSVTPSSGCLPSCTFPLLRRSVSLPCTYDDVRSHQSPPVSSTHCYETVPNAMTAGVRNPTLYGVSRGIKQRRRLSRRLTSRSAISLMEEMSAIRPQSPVVRTAEAHKSN